MFWGSLGTPSGKPFNFVQFQVHAAKILNEFFKEDSNE